MGNFTKVFTRTYEFDGDNVVVTMNRLKRKDAMLLAPFMQVDEGQDIKMAFESQLQFLDAAADVLPKCVVDMRGLFIEGEQVSVGSELFDMVMQDMYFMELLSLMLQDLVKESFVGGAQQGDVKKPSENTLTGSPTIAGLASEG